MEFNHASDIVKDLNFSDEARNRIMEGVIKLNNAVKSTLGASGKCVIYEDALGKPVVTKDGVTVANSVILRDPVENIGATLIKEAAQKTVKEAGDGTTTSTVLASAILTEAYKRNNSDVRLVKEGINSACQKVIKYLNKESIPVKDKMLEYVANISTNNDIQLGTVYALCLIYKKSVIIKKNKIYYDFTSNTDLEPLVIEYLQHGYCINYTRDRYKTIKDICLLLPYTGKLKSVGSYKIKELQDIALKLGIDIYQDNKKIVKSILYQRINSCIKN